MTKILLAFACYDGYKFCIDNFLEQRNERLINYSFTFS